MQLNKIWKEKKAGLAGNYMAYYDQVYAALTEENKSYVSGEDGMNVIQIIESAIESAATGKIISLG